jgi:hypothetical protein
MSTNEIRPREWWLKDRYIFDEPEQPSTRPVTENKVIADFRQKLAVATNRLADIERDLEDGVVSKAVADDQIECIKLWLKANI